MSTDKFIVDLEGRVACDFLVAVTARFRVLFVFLAMEVGSRRILHYNVPRHNSVRL